MYVINISISQLYSVKNEKSGSRDSQKRNSKLVKINELKYFFTNLKKPFNSYVLKKFNGM